MYSDENLKKKYLKYKMKYLELKNSYLNIEMKGGNKPFLTNYNINLFNHNMPMSESSKLTKQMEPYLNPIYGLFMAESGYITNNFHLYNLYQCNFDKSTARKDLKELPFAEKINKLTTKLVGHIHPQPIKKIRDSNIGLKPIDIGRYITILYFLKYHEKLLYITSKQDNVQFCITQQWNNINLINKFYKYTTIDSTKNITMEFKKELYKYNSDLNSYLNKCADIKKQISSSYYSSSYKSKCDNKKKQIPVAGVPVFEPVVEPVAGVPVVEPVVEPVSVPVIKPNDNINQIPNDNINQIGDIDFYIILYCLWWVLENDNGIQEYYKGINDVITICNKFLLIQDNPIQYALINLDSTSLEIPALKKFEEIVFNFTLEKFHIYDYDSSAASFYDDDTYNDCGETTARNLINLICFDPIKKRFNIDLLRNYDAIDELIQYYQVFNTFEKQSQIEKETIYDEKLNPRDAWSKLVIFYGNKNLRFVHKSTNHRPYELAGGMAINGEITNFFQLINNLLPKIKEWIDLNVSDRFEIESNTIDRNGQGEIIIKKLEEIFIIYFRLEHDHMEKIYNTDFNTHQFSGKEKFIIDILSKSNEHINIDNYIWIKWTPELLIEKMNDKFTDPKFKEKLLILSLKEQFNSDTRRQIMINVQDNDFFELFINTSKKYKINKDTSKKAYNKINKDTCKKAVNKINEYTYKANDFEFVRRLPPNLTHLNNCNINGSINRTEIKLDPFSDSNILTIGDNFLYIWVKLKEIDLTPLSKVTSIGDSFLHGCKELKNIDLTPLSKVTSIGNNFLNGCKELKNIDLTPLSKVTSIGYYFLNELINLEKIKVEPLLQLRSIGYKVLDGCKNLKYINDTNILSVKKIYNKHFEHGHWNLEDITFNKYIYKLVESK
jgi:hypothetical protein